jgi:hypothetical protein
MWQPTLELLRSPEKRHDMTKTMHILLLAMINIYIYIKHMPQLMKVGIWGWVMIGVYNIMIAVGLLRCTPADFQSRHRLLSSQGRSESHGNPSSQMKSRWQTSQFVTSDNRKPSPFNHWASHWKAISPNECHLFASSIVGGFIHQFDSQKMHHAAWREHYWKSECKQTTPKLKSRSSNLVQVVNLLADPCYAGMRYGLQWLHEGSSLFGNRGC